MKPTVISLTLLLQQKQNSGAPLRKNDYLLHHIGHLRLSPRKWLFHHFTNKHVISRITYSWAVGGLIPFAKDSEIVMHSFSLSLSVLFADLCIASTCHKCCILRKLSLIKVLQDHCNVRFSGYVVISRDMMSKWESIECNWCFKYLIFSYLFIVLSIRNEFTYVAYLSTSVCIKDKEKSANNENCAYCNCCS